MMLQNVTVWKETMLPERILQDLRKLQMLCLLREFANLNRVRAFGADFDIQVKRAGGSKLAVTIVNGKKTIKKTISEGQTITVRL